jgi:hypothetical protein
MTEPPFLCLVCGGRDYANRDRVFTVLDAIAAKHPNITILTGTCPTGADALAEEWAKARERPYIGVPAEWAKHGTAAGPMRNAVLLHYLPHGVVAFPGRSGTANMCDQAEEAGVRVWRVDG